MCKITPENHILPRSLSSVSSCLCKSWTYPAFCIDHYHFYLPNNTTVCTPTATQFRRAGQQGPTRTLTAALERLIKQLLVTYCAFSALTLLVGR